MLKRILEGKTEFQRRLNGKIWQLRHSLPEPSDKPLIRVGIPLVAKDRTDEWPVVEKLLNRTLASLLHQTNPDWQAVICGQDEPSLAVTDPRIRFKKYNVPSNFSDQRGKQAYLVDDLKATCERDGYYFSLDADDLLHPELFEHMRKDNNGQGYVLEAGYMLNAENSQLAPLYAPLAPLNTACGSSTALRFDFRSDFHFEQVLRKRGQHGSVHNNMAYFGLKMQPVSFPSVLYLVNHGENMQKRRGKIDGKVSYVNEHKITDADYIARIRADFKMDELGL